MGRKRKPAAEPEPSDDDSGSEEIEEIEVEVEEEEEESDGKEAGSEQESEEAEGDEGSGADVEGEEAPPAKIDPESIRKLLEPFPKEQLVSLLTAACLKNTDLLSRLTASAATDISHRKLFVYGLCAEATSASLSDAFSCFGPIEECKAVLDRATSRCKSYGFVIFESAKSARRALAAENIMVAGHRASCQLASTGPPSAQDMSTRKLYVGNVPANAAPDRLRRLFEEFGEIEEGPLGGNRDTGAYKGYALFIYKSPDGLRKALEEPKKMFDGCELFCQRASGGGDKKSPAVHVQANDLALPAYASQPLYGIGPMPGLLNQGLLGQNAGFAPLLGSGLVGSVPSSLNRNALSPYGVGLGLGGSAAGISSLNPGLLGAYASQAALQGGLGIYHTGQLSSAGTTSTLSQGSSVGSAGLAQYYLGR